MWHKLWYITGLFQSLVPRKRLRFYSKMGYQHLPGTGFCHFFCELCIKLPDMLKRFCKKSCFKDYFCKAWFQQQQLSCTLCCGICLHSMFPLLRYNLSESVSPHGPSKCHKASWIYYLSRCNMANIIVRDSKAWALARRRRRQVIARLRFCMLGQDNLRWSVASSFDGI